MNNYIIIYDGTFINLLSTIKYLLQEIKYLLQEHIKPQNIIIEGSYSLNLFETLIKPNIINDEKFINKIISISSHEIFKIIYYTFLIMPKIKN